MYYNQVMKPISKIFEYLRTKYHLTLNVYYFRFHSSDLHARARLVPEEPV